MPTTRKSHASSRRPHMPAPVSLPLPAKAANGCAPNQTKCRSHDEQPLGADACGAASMLSQSARAHQAALACAPPRPDVAALTSGRWSVGGTKLESYQASRQGLYVLPVQVRG